MSRSINPLLAGLLAILLAAMPGFAFEPPIDRAGELSARIEGPKEVTQTATPLPVRVVLENQELAPIAGTVELGVIDGWAARPAGPVQFSVEGKGSATLEFTVTAGAKTYNAHYPIHAYAKFTSNGQELIAHPILVLETKLPEPPRAGGPPEWKPFVVAREGQLPLWRLPAQRAVVQVYGAVGQTMPIGWRGVDNATGATISIQSEDLGAERHDVVAIHPPYRDGRIGTALMEFPLVLPAKGPISLRFENAVTPTGQGDGVTFRVRVLPFEAPEGQLGEVVYEKHSKAKRWGQTGEADLSKYAGRAIRLQLESNPGPQNNTGWDQSFWAEPTLVAGVSASRPSAPFPPRDAAGSSVLGTIRAGSRSVTVRIWPGNRGLLDTVVGFSGIGEPVLFRGFEFHLLGTRLDDPRSSIGLGAIQVERGEGTYRVRHHVESPLGSADLVGALAIKDGVLRASFHLENLPAPQPWKAVFIEDVALGPWSRPARRVYAGHGNVLRDPEAFSLGFDGHRLATSFVGVDFQGGLAMVQGVDVPPSSFEVRPDGKQYSLHAAHNLTYTLIPAATAFDAVKVWRQVNGLKPAGGVEAAAGRFVFDLWGGHYAPSASALRRAFRYGLGDSMVVWHNWQRWGYDYRLPDIVPPNPELGTLEEMKGLIAVCKQAGTRFAVHDNYIDFYPDADGFSYERSIAFDAGGHPVRAWFNEGRDAQSYRYRTDQAATYLKRNVAWIRDQLAPTAYFIDVWSSAMPYDYWTADGKFVDRVHTRTTWGELFAWIRDRLGDHAPTISESGHDQLIGWLDGAQTNHLRVGPPVTGSREGGTVWNWKCADAERTPWFDAAHHDRFILHGAGYSSRYEAGLDPRLHGIYSDDYIATEVLTGHPAMVSEPFSSQVVRKHWLLNDLMRALALRKIEGVEYVKDDLHRQHVTWSGGGEVWVNRGETDWKLTGHILPQYGFYARVPTEKGTVEAAIERKDGLIVESARAPEQLYANARALLDDQARIRPSLTGVRFSGGRNFLLGIRWDAGDPIPAGYQPFFHICDDKGAILFQAQQDPAAFRSARTGAIRTAAKAALPETVKPGTTLEVRAGLFDSKGGQRMALAGPDDGESRIRLGKIRVEGQGDVVTGLSWTPGPGVSDPTLARRNPAGKVVDFGPMVTPAAARLTRDGQSLVVTPLPSAGDRSFELRLRWNELPWRLAPPTRIEAIAEDGTVAARETIRRSGDLVVLTCRSNVFQYRLIGE